jgi:RNA polymerase sigma-70 factor (ECF subfamily)
MYDIDAAVEAVRRGDRNRYRHVVEACEAPVRVVVAAILPDGAPVDDVVHEAFLTGFLKLGDYTAGTDFVAWMKQIARNTAHNERRRFTRHQQMKRRARGAIEELVAPAVDELMAADRGGEALAALRDCVAALGEPARGLVQRHYFEGAAYADLARAAGRTAAWVRLVLFRARLALGRCLAYKGALADG